MNIRRTILIGTLVRVILMPFTAHPFDMYSWYNYCSSVLERGFDPNALLTSVRPLWDLLLAGTAYVYGFLSATSGLRAFPISELPSSMNPQWGIQYIPGALFNTLVKTPLVLSDIATALLLYKMISEMYEHKLAEKATLLYYLNPAVIWISAVWGQYEAIPTFLTVLSIYFLAREKFVFSSLSLLAATLFKVYPAALLVPITTYLFKRKSRGILLRYLAVFLVPVSSVIAVSGDYVSRFVLEFFSTETFHGIFGFGLNYWSISMLYPLNSDVFTIISIGLTVALLSFSIYNFYKADFSESLRDLMLSAVLIAASLFLSIRFPTEQRIVWLMPFLAWAVSKGYLSGKLFWTLSAIAFLYMQKNFPYYLLPVAIFNERIFAPLFSLTETLKAVANGVIMPTATTAAMLSFLGVSFSLLMLVVYWKSSHILKLNRP